jgi:large subunit ribosomal protein L23
MKHIKNINDVLIKPLVTEKSYAQMADNVYSFIVHDDATKTDVK